VAKNPDFLIPIKAALAFCYARARMRAACADCGAWAGRLKNTEHIQGVADFSSNLAPKSSAQIGAVLAPIAAPARAKIQKCQILFTVDYVR